VLGSRDLKSHFLLDPEIAFLNHGSFGACPRPVFEAYQRYQRELEREPVDFLQRTFPPMMRAARGSLARFLGCGADDVSFVRNATYGMNLAARSVRVGAGDTVVSTDLEYGAVDRMWQTICNESGAKLVRANIPLPAASPDEVVEAVAEHLDSSVRVASFSHIAAEAGQRFPVERLVRLAAEAGTVSVVDGAHAPGQLPLDLATLGADFYVGNCHKWMLSPKGAAFVYASEEWASKIRPPVVSWGDISEGTSSLLLENEWQGTADISAFLAVADAIEFLEQHRWLDEIVPRCAQLISDADLALLGATGQESLYQSAELRLPQISTYRLPDCDHRALHADLYHRFQVEVPVFETPHGCLLRVSVQGYNSASDLERLVAALEELL